MFRYLLLVSLLVVSIEGHADAMKCRTSNGKIEITDGACSAGSRAERVQGAEYISADRQRQAHRVNAQNTAQVNGIEAEKAAYSESVRQQQNAFAKADARQAAADGRKAAIDSQNKQLEECARLSSRRNVSIDAKCAGVLGFDGSLQRELPTAPEPPKPLSVIKTCNGASCSDQYGSRYDTSASGKTVRSDGKRCYQQGRVMYCD